MSTPPDPLLNAYLHDGDYTFAISIGFEFETANGFPLRLDEAFVSTVSYEDKQSIAQSGFPIRLNDRVEMTGDFLNPNLRQISQSIRAYRQSKQHLPHIGILFNIQTSRQQLGDLRHMFLPQQSLRCNRLFGSLEFICTFPEIVRVPAKKLSIHLPVYLVHAEYEIRTVFEKTFSRRITVDDETFPSQMGVYSPSTGTAILFYKGFEDIYQWKFRPQVTFGINYRHLPRFLLYFFHNVDPRPNQFMRQSVDFFESCRSLTNPLYRGYLFLFYYSFVTGQPKQGKLQRRFLFRFLFSQVWEAWIGERGREILWEYLNETRNGEEDLFVQYFAQIHISKTTQQQHNPNLYRRRRQALQDMDDSTLFDRRFPEVFVEYRGLFRFVGFHHIDTDIFYPPNV